MVLIHKILKMNVFEGKNFQKKLNRSKLILRGQFVGANVGKKRSVIPR